MNSRYGSVGIVVGYSKNRVKTCASTLCVVKWEIENNVQTFL